MSGYKCPPKVTFPTTSKINWCKTWLALKDDFSRSRLSHLYPLINKAKKKSNQISYLVSIHLIFPLTEINLRSRKWLLSCSYNPRWTLLNNHIQNISRGLDFYSSKYDNVIVLGNFYSSNTTTLSFSEIFIRRKKTTLSSRRFLFVEIRQLYRSPRF